MSDFFQIYKARFPFSNEEFLKCQFQSDDIRSSPLFAEDFGIQTLDPTDPTQQYHVKVKYGVFICMKLLYKFCLNYDRACSAYTLKSFEVILSKNTYFFHCLAES